MGRVRFPFETPYVNTIHVSQQPDYPGDSVLERRIKSIIRWNALAMVVRANRGDDDLGGHISTFASSATLFQVALMHFLKGHDHPGGGDQIFFQGHAAPGIYAQAFMEGRLNKTHLENFRREVSAGKGKGLSSYPHPWLMRNFWEFPSVSMGLSPMQAIYQARFNRYLTNRGLKDCSASRVWAFMGDGEMDEPESMGALTVASREKLDNLTFVINCNLQRLDGPVRGNGKIIQELESAFRGAGWNVIKVIWGRDWDPLFAKDEKGYLLERATDALDGDYQKYTVESGAYIREHFFGKQPELLKMVENLSDEQLQRLRRGGHDPHKVYAGLNAAVQHTGQPTAVICKTIKGYGLGEAGEGRNVTHSQKVLDEEELRYFRDRFDIPLTDAQLKDMPFYRPAEDSEEVQYVLERRRALGGFVPSRQDRKTSVQSFSLEEYKEFTQGTAKGRAVSTTMAYVSFLAKLLRHPTLGKKIVPIIPDEGRTFGMDPLFRQIGIYSSVGQLYEPVDSKMLLYYKEAKEGQLLEEGITEDGAIASFNAAATSEASHGVATIPMYIYYSMFGFQRIGDFIWSAQDMCARGFLFGATSGRTTLNGEGLQHQDGHSHVFSSCYPRVRSYDPAFAYEILVLLQHGIYQMFEQGENLIYYLTLHNENYEMPKMPENCEEGIVKGMYKYKPAGISSSKHVQLLGSGSILVQVLEAARLLEEEFGVAADVWSVTSFTELRREALDVERWNMLHPTEKLRVPWISQQLAGVTGPVVAATDWMKIVPDQVARWVPTLYALGTDGLGRSDTREALRRHFEIDAASIVIATLHQLMKQGKCEAHEVQKAMQRFEFDGEKLNPAWA